MNSPKAHYSLTYYSKSNMALIPPFYFNCVVAIGKRESKDEINWIGTGTLVGRFYKKSSLNAKHYHIFIVTNKHVMENNSSLVIRFNPLNSRPAKDYDIPVIDKSGKAFWKSHPNPEIDLAAICLDADFLQEEGVSYQYFHSDLHLMPLNQMAKQGMSEGDFIYVLGFPMGIMAPNRQYVISRTGIIARLRDTIEGTSNDFMIDSMIFPGNSGGPVINKPEIISIEGTNSVPSPYLIGIVASYLTYTDTAVSKQTGQSRVVFEENSGLAIVIPADYILETIDTCFATANIKEAICH